MSAASQARRRRSPDELEIVAFERGHYTSYSPCGIPYYVGGVFNDFERLIVRDPAEFRAKQSIDARTRHEVTEVDLERRAVKVHDMEKRAETWEPFDELVVATGSVPIRPDVPGADADGIHGVQVLDDGVFLRHLIEGQRPGRAVVVGGGYIGLGMAEALVLRGVQVSLVERAPHPMTTLDPDMGALVSDALRGLGIDLYENESVSGFETKDDHVTAVVTEARTLPADIVILGLGARPNVELAGDGGVPIGPSGGIATD